MKFAAKLFLVVAIFCVTTFADDDGHMTTGGLTCKGPTCPAPTPTPTPSLHGEPNSANRQNNEQNPPEESILDYIHEYLRSLFG